MTDVPREDTKPARAEAGKLGVFISYSREDIAFADQLVAALATCGFAPTMDVHAIDGGEAWQQRLGALILEADTVVFVLSPASAASKVCEWEVEEAVRHSKRIVPVVARPLGTAIPPQHLRDLNYVFFYPEPKTPQSGFGTGLAELVDALNTDRAWIRQHTRLLERATEWDLGGRPVSRLLSGTDIAQAKTWAAQRPSTAPEPTELHLRYIRASEEEEARRASLEHQRLKEMEAAQEERAKALRDAEDAVRERQDALREKQEETRRNARLWKGIGVGSAVVGALLLIAALDARDQRNKAEAQREIAEAERANAETNLKQAQLLKSRDLVQSARRMTAVGDHTTAILLALEALPEKPDDPRRRPIDEVIARYARDGLRERFAIDGAASLSPDGRLLLTTSASAPAKLLDASSRELRLVLGGDDEMPAGAAFNKRGDRAVVHPQGKAPRLWDVDAMKELPLEGVPPPAAITSVSFSPAGRFVLMMINGEPPRVWDSATGKTLIALADAEEDVVGAAFSPDDSHVVIRTARGAPKLKAMPAGNTLFSVDRTANRVVFSTAGGHLLTFDRNRVLAVWNTATGARLELRNAAEPVLAASFSPDARFLLTRSRGVAPRLWDLATFTPLFQVGDAVVNAAVFSPDSKLLLTQSGRNAPVIWDTSSGARHATLGEEAIGPQQPVFSRDGSLVLTDADGDVALLWETGTGKQRHKLKASSIGNAVFSADKRWLLALSKEAPTVAERTATAVQLWDLSQALSDKEEGLAPVNLAADGHSPRSITFSKDGTFVLTSDRSSAYVWDVGGAVTKLSRDELPASKATVDQVQATIPRCLTVEQRKVFFLSPRPPRWCIEGGRHPYDTRAWTTNDAVDSNLAAQFGDFAHRALQEGDGRNALEAAELSMAFAPKVEALVMNRAHALMYLGRRDEARKIYLAHRGERVRWPDGSDIGLWEDLVRKDFKNYRERGHEFELMSEIEEQFGPAAEPR